jgi:hypothetical protein
LIWNRLNNSGAKDKPFCQLKPWYHTTFITLFGSCVCKSMAKKLKNYLIFRKRGNVQNVGNVKLFITKVARQNKVIIANKIQ